jgi:hypothetical protein
MGQRVRVFRYVALYYNISHSIGPAINNSLNGMKSELPQGTLHYDVMKYSGILKTSVSSETSVITYKTSRRYNPEDSDQHTSLFALVLEFATDKKCRYVIKLRLNCNKIINAS